MTSAAVVVLVALVGATPAAAATPANDTFGAAEPVASLPFSAVLDTSEATTDPLDAEANLNCGAPATEASVWYAYTSASGLAVTVDVSQSDYSAGVIVVRGSPGSFILDTCGPAAVVFSPIVGETYWILAFDDTPGGPNGGTLRLNVSEASPAQVDLELDPKATVDPRTGVATISGTVTCSGADSAFLSISLSQRVGRFTISGNAFTVIGPCDGTPQPWSFEITGTNGKFAGGAATLDAWVSACGPFNCAFDESHSQVRLKRR